MSRILALDTTQATCSVALHVDTELWEASVQTPRQHTKQILPLVDQVLTQAGVALKDLDAIAFGRGPGSFTGLRIACGVAQGLAFSTGLPLIPVSSLAAVAVAAFEQQPQAEYCLASFDARMNQVYGGFYQQGSPEPLLVGEEWVTEPENIHIPDAITTTIAAGSGLSFVETMPQSLQANLQAVAVDTDVEAKYLLPMAVAAWQRGETVAPELAEPAYVRQQVAWKKINEQ